VRTIAVVTTSRADYSHLLPLLRAIDAEPELALVLIVSGTHLSTAYGKTVTEIEKDGFSIAERIPVLTESDAPVDITAAMGRAVAGFGETLARHRPDILVVLGDRFEMHAAALAALPFKIPVAHISGGDVTEGAIDDALRHSMTKLSHLHFPSSEESARRILQLGEEPWRVMVCGELSLDNLSTFQPLAREELEAEFGLRLPERFLLVTYHPVTLEYEQAEWQIAQLLQALDALALTVVFTMPNADTANRVIGDAIREFTRTHPAAWQVDNFGMRGYFSVLSLATAMVGNSSSGVLEAASFKLPVVNIGTRQYGRARARNVIDCGYSSEEILAAMRKAVSAEFRSSLRDLTNPCGNGGASAQIVHQLKTVAMNEELTRKRFVNLVATNDATVLSAAGAGKSH
jgi:UDP-hydrolysing UDP-N-acetyl-D-glucosamine 2-epimerase